MENLLRKLKIKSGDLIIIIILGVLIGFSLTYSRLFMEEGRWVSITVDSTPVKRVLLSHDDKFSISGPAGISECIVADGKIWIQKAPCPHKYCQSMGKIHRSGETVICIPNRLVIAIEGEHASAIDAITQ